MSNARPGLELSHRRPRSKIGRNDLEIWPRRTACLSHLALPLCPKAVTRCLVSKELGDPCYMTNATPALKPLHVGSVDLVLHVISHGSLSQSIKHL